MELLALPPTSGPRRQARTRRLHIGGIVITAEAGGTRLRLEGDPIRRAAQPETRRALVDRLFSLPALLSLRLDPRRGSVCLTLDRDRGTTEEFLDALAHAMRSPAPRPLPLPLEEALLTRPDAGPVEIARLGRELTFWRIETLAPDRFRLRHPLLASVPLREQVVLELRRLPDVVGHAASLFQPATLHLRVKPHRVDPTDLRDTLDPVLVHGLTGNGLQPATLTETLVHTNLVLAPISDFLFPPLGIANFLLVAAINRNHVAPALSDLREGRTNLHLLYLSIGLLTLLTFDFFAAATMYWLLLFWPRKAEQMRLRHEADFLSHFLRYPQRVWVDREGDGTSVETPLHSLPPRSVVVLGSDDIVPGDGVIVSGRALVNDRLITGTAVPREKAAGDRLYASSRVLEGQVRLRIDALQETTVAGQRAAWHRAAWVRQRTEKEGRAHRFAEKAVLPTMLFGALALTRGGLGMAKAVLRPDYLSGPLLSDTFLDLATTIRGAQHGILLADLACLDVLLEADTIIFDDTVAWQLEGSPGHALVEALQAYSFSEIVFFSERSAGEAARLGFDHIEADHASEDKRTFLSRRQTMGHGVVYVGDCLGEKQRPIAAQADLAICVRETPDLPPFSESSPPIVFLGADLNKVIALIDLARDTAQEARAARHLTLAPNIAASGAALYLGASVSAAVLLTNLGTFANYLRHSTTLHLTGARTRQLV